MKHLLYSLAVISLCAITGCNTMESNYSRNKKASQNYYNQQQLKKQANGVQRVERAQNQLRKDIDALYEKLLTMEMKVNTTQTKSGGVGSALGDLQQRLNRVISENNALKQDVARLKSQQNAHKQETQKAISSSVNKMATETAKAISNLEKQMMRQSSSRPAPSGNYDIYVVERGATLSTIAQAAGVSISSIKRANNLKKDIIFVGQKLKIPR